MADGRHIENRLLAISQRLIVRLARDLVQRSIITFRHRSHDQNAKFRKFKMADGRHFENGFITISAGSHPTWTKFGVQTQILFPKTVTWQSIEILKNVGRPPYWKSFLGYISTIFVRLMRNLVWRSRISLRHRSHGQNNRPSFCLWVTVSDYVGLQIWWMLWVNRRCLPMLTALQGYISDQYPVEILNLVRHR